MKTWDEARADFKKNNNFISIKKSCGNCKYFDWDEIKGRCTHKDLMAYDGLGRKSIAHFPVYENNACDNFEEVG